MVPFVPSIIVVSGASRGYGLACATELSKQFPSAKLHLMASSVDRLAATMRVVSGHVGGVKCHGVDLFKLAAGDMAGTADLTSCLSQATTGQKVLFVHSAAVLGPTGAIEKLGLKDVAASSQAVQVNVAGSLALAVLVASSLPNGLQDLHCVNVSSKAAVIPGMFDLFDVMAVTKSAAHFMFASMATRGARVLQYCPGPMKTDMNAGQHDLDWPWVKPDDSARAMVALIKENMYDNNACIDYLDDGLAEEFPATLKLPMVEPAPVPGPAPSTPPKGVDPEAWLVPGTVNPSEAGNAKAGLALGTAACGVEARGAPPVLRKCMITRIEAFSSSHTLQNCSWTEPKNRETFGKCCNLHGHNYKAEFSFSGYIDPETGMVANLSVLKLILQEFLDRLDHSHLNDHVDMFQNAPTTAEVISQVLFDQVAARLTAKGVSVELVKVKVWETDKNIAEYPYLN